MQENWCKSFFGPLDKKISTPHIEWCIGKCPGLCTMHRSTAGHNPYNLFILTIVYSKNLPTS